MTEYERFGLVFTKTRVYKFGHWGGGGVLWRAKMSASPLGTSPSLHGLYRMHGLPTSCIKHVRVISCWK
jgi:hypothetical protein